MGSYSYLWVAKRQCSINQEKVSSMRHSLHSPSVLLKESDSLGVIVDGYSTNFISTAEPDMRVSSHPGPREKRPTSENPTRKSGRDQWQWSEVDQNTRLRFKYISGPMDRNDWPAMNTQPSQLGLPSQGNKKIPSQREKAKATVLFYKPNEKER